jgi:putative redox protein
MPADGWRLRAASGKPAARRPHRGHSRSRGTRGVLMSDANDARRSRAACRPDATLFEPRDQARVRTILDLPIRCHEELTDFAALHICGRIRAGCAEILDGRQVMSIEVETRNVGGAPTAIGSAGPYTLVVDRPRDGGGGGLGFNGGQLLYLSVAGCVSNDLFREARAMGIALHRVRVAVRGDFSGDPAVSSEITYEVEIDGDASEEHLRQLVERVDRIAEIPNSLRRGTEVRLRSAQVGRGSL